MPVSGRSGAFGVAAALAVAWGVATAASAAPASDPAAQVEAASASEFGEAVAAYRAGRLDEAIERIRRVLDLDRADPDALWNLGLWTAEAGRHEEALEAWTRYREAAPADWRARAKRVQALQALGRDDERDRERSALRDARAAGDDPALAGAEVFCRDQFEAGGRRVFAMERFEPAGARPTTIEFRVVGDGGAHEGGYALASWDDDNAVPWEASTVSRAHRAYRLARVGRGGYEVVTRYQGEPKYERVRRDVEEDLALRAARAARERDGRPPAD